jgi:fibronectin-binding autotransporter adhesin
MRDVRCLLPSILLCLMSAAPALAQSTFTWSTSTTGFAWLNSSNWTGGPANKFAGDTNQASATAENNPADIAQFSTLAFSGSSLGINFNNVSSNTGNGNNANANGRLTLGAIDILSTLSKNFSVGKSDATSITSVLQLGGRTLGATNNVVIRNSSANNFTVTPTATGGGGALMGLQLTNSTVSNILVESSGNVLINSVVSDNGTGTGNIGVGGAGTGRVDLASTANTFTGTVTVTGSDLRIAADGSLGNSANTVTIDGGKFSTGSTTSFALAATRGVFVGDGSGTEINVHGAGTMTIDGVIADKSGEVGGFAKRGAGTLSLNGSNIYTGETTVGGGVLALSASGALSASSSVVLAGGTLSVASGITNGSASGGTLTVTGSNTIDFGAPGATTILRFGNSSAAVWTGSPLLTITGWNGSMSGSGTSRLFVGSDATGLTATQLSNITFSGFGIGAAILSTGEVVPVPEPGTALGIAAAGLGVARLVRRRRA